MYSYRKCDVCGKVKRIYKMNTLTSVYSSERKKDFYYDICDKCAKKYILKHISVETAGSYED